MSSAEEHTGEFGDYLLLDEIGRGSAGVVFQARQKSLDRVVALKMIRTGQSVSREAVERFHEEARVAARIRHPNIVAIHEVGEMHGTPYIAMDYIEGGSLVDRIEREEMSLDQVVSLLATISRAVHHLHENGIIHRDLKPSNIMIGKDGQPYVTDFGLAMMYGAGASEKVRNVVTGTPRYMSPEQASGNVSSLTPRTDIYCLGTILYELLAGFPPLVGDDLMETLVKIIEREPLPLASVSSRIPREVDWICMRCLDKRPEKRYSSALDLADDLDRFLRGEELKIEPPTRWDRLRRWIRRAPALAVHWLGIAVFFLINLMNYAVFSIVDTRFFLTTSVLLLVWAPVCSLFQRWMKRDGRAGAAHYGWALADMLFLTVILLQADGVSSPLIIGYPLLIAGSGLLNRTRLVWFMTGLTMLSYAGLLFDSIYFRPGLSVSFDSSVIFLVSMAILGFMVAYQVGRIHAMNRYFRSRCS